MELQPALLSDLVSLTVIAVVAFAAPFVASLIPGRPIPETVFLVFAGTLLGPNGVGLVHPSTEPMQLLSQLGLAFLFLMAGYEIEPRQIRGPMGRHASLCWLVSLGLAFALAHALPLRETTTDVGLLAFAIAMTTTAYGTLAPILRDRNLVRTPVGDAVMVYGAIGELLPVLAIAALLSSHSTTASVILLAVFVLLCLDVWRRTKRAAARGSRIVTFMRENAETGSQTTVRATVLLLVFLVTVSRLFDFDAVLGAFAAGFILRSTVPDGDHVLEVKLDAIAFGFLVPLFFVMSGAAIDLSAVAANPALLFGFMALLLVVRALPVGLSLRLSPETRRLSATERLTAALYCSMALPIIVAVTSVAVELDAMSQSMASVLVCAGALTVLLVPLATSLVLQAQGFRLFGALGEVAEHPAQAGTVMREHRRQRLEYARAFRKERRVLHEEGMPLSSAEYLALREYSKHLHGRDDARGAPGGEDADRHN
jgi:Kef-type K+ transport system membrane component KefB